MGMEYEAMMERGSLEESCRKRGVFCVDGKGGFLSNGVCSCCELEVECELGSVANKKRYFNWRSSNWVL